MAEEAAQKVQDAETAVTKAEESHEHAQMALRKAFE